MEQGTIQKMFSYYFGNPQFKEEILRALREFFNKPDLKPGDKLEVMENDGIMFNEWFIFDFRLNNGKTPLEDFYQTNPYNLNLARLQVYKDLQENHFGFYEVLDVRWGEGLRLKNLQTGKIYEVREYAATFSLKREQVFSTRVTKVVDHYELVGSNASFGPVKINPKLKKILKESKEKLNPKILRDAFRENRPSLTPLGQYPTFEEAEENLRKVLEKYGLDKFVNTETIKAWIYNHSKDDPFPSELNLLFGLLYPDMENYDKSLIELLDVFNVFYNLCPQKALGDKSAFEKREEQEQKGIPPDLVMSLRKFPLLGWAKKYSQALKYMKQRKFKQALEKFNEVFAYLLKNKTTYPEIYRLYANKGICHFVLGEVELGEFLLKTSVALNPFYDFGKEQLRKYKKSGYLKKTKIARNKQDFIEDPGYRYWQFLKQFKINFVQPLKEPTPVSTILNSQKAEEN